MKKSIFSCIILMLITTSQASAQMLTAGAVYGNELGCIKQSGGDGLDAWRQLTLKGIEAHETYCEFVDLQVSSKGDYLASAICYSEGFVAPDLFSISPIGEGNGFEVSNVGNDIISSPVGIFEKCEAK
ncbi:MAG: hypothetical protein L3J21_10370 [Devosiaceae bacterium]|nr:hypothetical protein [Devosiaceae bacterium]